MLRQLWRDLRAHRPVVTLLIVFAPALAGPTLALLGLSVPPLVWLVPAFTAAACIGWWRQRPDGTPGGRSLALGVGLAVAGSTFLVFGFAAPLLILLARGALPAPHTGSWAGEFAELPLVVIVMVVVPGLLASYVGWLVGDHLAFRRRGRGTAGAARPG